MNPYTIPFSIVIAIALWLLAEWIGPPAYIIIYSVAGVILGLVVLKGIYTAFHDGDKQSLLMWGEFYLTIGVNTVYDKTNERRDKRAFKFEIGFERPEEQ